MNDEYEAYLLWKVSARQQIDWYREEVRELKAENAKLRELAENLMISAGMEREEIMAALQRLMNVVKG